MEVSSIRRYDLDWMRIFGILMLFPFHSARVFDYWEPNYVQNSQLSDGLSMFIFLAAYWFMPMMFFVAGASSWHALKKRTGGQYIKERVWRLLIPLIFGILIVVPPQGYFAQLHHNNFSGSFMDFIRVYFTDFSDLSGYFGTCTPAHLWFILYLFIISLCALPIMKSIKKRYEQSGDSRSCGFINSIWFLILLFIPTTLAEALPDIAGKNPFYFLFIFIIGYTIAMKENIQQNINKIRFKVLIFLVVYLPVYSYLFLGNSDAPDYSAMNILLTFMRNLLMWTTLIVIIGYANKFLNFGGKLLKYANNAAFPVYVLHQTVLIGVSYYIVQLQIMLFIKFMLIVVITFVLCIAIYEIAKRFKATRFILGIKE